MTTSSPTVLLELGGSTVVEHVGGEQTGGAVALVEFRIEPGYPVPPAHIHEREDELTYVIEGALEITIDNDTRTVRAGESMFKPRGIAHGFAVAGEAPVRFLETITPAGFEGYFRAIAAAVRDNGGVDREFADCLMTAYGVRSGHRPRGASTSESVVTSEGPPAIQPASGALEC